MKEAQNELNLKGSLLELFKVKIYRRNLIIMVIVWSFASFAFFCVPFYIGTIPANMYLMNSCTAVAEIISSFVCLALPKTADLRRSISLFCFMSCIGSVGIMIFNGLYSGSSQVPQAILYLLLYVGVVTAFDLVYLVVNQLFPTIFLGTAYGACNIVGRFISIMSPIVARVE